MEFNLLYSFFYSISAGLLMYPTAGNPTVAHLPSLTPLPRPHREAHARRGGHLRKISHLPGRLEVTSGPAVRAWRDHCGTVPFVGVLQEDHSREVRAVFTVVRSRLARPKGRLLVREVVVPHILACGRRSDVSGAAVELVVGAKTGGGDSAYHWQVDERPHERPDGGDDRGAAGRGPRLRDPDSGRPAGRALLVPPPPPRLDGGAGGDRHGGGHRGPRAGRRGARGGARSKSNGLVCSGQCCLRRFPKGAQQNGGELRDHAQDGRVLLSLYIKHPARYYKVCQLGLRHGVEYG